jgi:molecular chaperone HtpG
VDLLQITQHRTPAVLFRLINPTDPISQREWAKQGGVTRIRAKEGFDKDGNPSSTAPTDTVEVFAEFNDDIGFFGLTSYLIYARSQLKKSNEIVEKSRKLTSRRYLFPWREIDDSYVEAHGFMKQTFGFSLDQARILDLLTGHTLYNDSNVVIRELLQNAIDAVRLQALIDQKESTRTGKISVRWSNSEGLLEIIDNGTGMNQETIENHLLKVGASKYQNPQFKEFYPTFSSISRFGIGVLSAFMVADSVEIVTCSVDDDIARRISLRSVHGRYLIRLLEKGFSDDAKIVSPHGTIVRLRFRPSAKRVNILTAMRRWIKFPRCAVTLSIDDAPEVQVGFESPKAALQAYLESGDSPLDTQKVRLDVLEKEIDGVAVAYALIWSEVFRDWTFASVNEPRDVQSRNEEGDWPICTCVEGVAVVPGTPGFEGFNILAVANAVGHKAPKTNVARLSIEDTEEARDLTGKVYHAYVQQIADEVARLVDSERYSISWATSQIPFLSSALFSQRARGGNQQLRRNAIAELPLFIIEEGEDRKVASLVDLKKAASFWTMDSVMMRSAERLVRESSSEITIRQLMSACHGTKIPEGTILCNLDAGSLPREVVGNEFEVESVEFLEKQRQLYVRWARAADPSRWIRSQEARTILGRKIFDDLSEIPIVRRSRGAGRVNTFAIPISDIPQKGLSSFLGFVCYGSLYILPIEPIGIFLHNLATAKESFEYFLYCYAMLHISRGGTAVGLKEIEENLDKVLDVPEKEPDFRKEFVEAMSKSNFRVADPFATSERYSEYDL